MRLLARIGSLCLYVVAIGGALITGVIFAALLVGCVIAAFDPNDGVSVPVAFSLGAMFAVGIYSRLRD